MSSDQPGMSWILPSLAPNFDAAVRDVHAARTEFRVAAAERLGRASQEEREAALRALCALLDDSEATVRRSALSGLGALGDPSVIDRVVLSFGDPVSYVRECAALATSQIGGPLAIDALRKALQHSAPEVRFQAVAGLADMRPEACERDLLPLVADSDEKVRAQVAAALGCLGHIHLSGHLVRLAQDTNLEVRIEAALALASLGDVRAEPVLREALHAKQRLIEVADALAHLGCGHTVNELSAIALGWFTQPHVRAATGAALVRLGDPRGIRALRRVLRGFHAGARSFAVGLVAELGATELVPELVRVSRSARGADPFVTVDALSRFAARSVPARLALERLARRTDSLGQAARATFTGCGSSKR